MATKTRMRHVLMIAGGESAGTRMSQPVVYRNISGRPQVNLIAPLRSLTYASLNPVIIEFGATLHPDYVPATTDFSVVKNSVAATISSVAIEGSAVHLTLAVNLLVGDTLTVQYTKPTANTRLRDYQGNEIASFGPITVKNITLAGSLGAFQGDAFQTDAFQV